MKNYLMLKLLAFALIICSVYSFKAAIKDGVVGWYLAGSNPKNYQIGVEKSAARGGNVGYLRSVVDKSGFGTIMQTFEPKEYLGKRVRLTGYIKTENVKDWAGMWFRIDGEKDKNLGFDNMQKRAIKGKTDWTKYSIVLDVPQESKAIAFGVLLSGAGNVWLDDLEFEIVNKSVPLTVKNVENPNQPVNTGFEEN